MRKGRKQGSEARNARNPSGPRNLEQYFARSAAFRDRWNQVTRVISRMRADRVSLRKTSKEFGLTPQTVIRWGGSGLRKSSNGQYVAKLHDRLLRVLVIATRKGLREIGVRDSRQASLLGRYWTAVERYRDTGDASALRKFRGKYILDTSGKRYRLLTDLRALDRLGSAGVLSFETLYAKAA